jgi:hypothetical protein
MLGVDAGGSEKDQPVGPGLVGGLDDALFDGQVVADKVRRVAVVGQNAADARRRQHHKVRLFCLKELACRVRIAQVELVGRAAHEVRVAVLLKVLPDGPAGHAAMARDVYFVIQGFRFHKPKLCY